MNKLNNDSINEEKNNLRKIIIDYSANTKNYAKWFEIAEVEKNQDTYTTYKVIYRFLPKDINESIKEFVIWKRFRDFKDLYQSLSSYHVSLHRKDKFPEFAKSKFWNRFDDKIIEERKECSLKLLQFIGSQSHLYRHEKFVEFLLDSEFVDYSDQSNNKNEILKPVNGNSLIESSNTPNKSIEKILNQIKKLSENDIELISNKTYDFIIEYLIKTKKLINLSIKNENSGYHYAAGNLLKSASNTLVDCLSEKETKLNKEQKSRLEKQFYIFKDIINNLNLYVDKISNAIESGNANQIKKSFLNSNKILLENDDELPKINETNALNDWELSEFNLLSNDFNNELYFISGNLFDLNFTYKLSRILNNNCFIMKLRHPMKAINQSPEMNSGGKTKNSGEFILKCLQKSSSPNLLNKSMVPYGKKIPYMCKLIKYYESDSTIFLLIEYLELGKLYFYLSFLLEYGDCFSIHLDKFKTMKKQCSIENHSKTFTNFRRKSCEIDQNVDSKNWSKNIRRTFSVRENYKISNNADIIYETKLESTSNEKFSSNIKINNSTNSLSIDESPLSNDNQKLSLEDEERAISIINIESSSSNDNIEQIETNKNSSWKVNNSLKKIINLESKSKNSIIKFKNKSSNHDGKSENIKSNIFQKPTPYVAQIETWLAQLAYSLKCLHDLGIVCKDLRSDNLLLASNGQLCLTYISKWNLVDEKLNKQAIKNFYVAPELTGLVNYFFGESSDWWSFGVIAYELLTMKKFSSVHTSNHIYVNNIIYPDDFKNELAKDLLKNILVRNPEERFDFEKIKNHSFFSNTNWNSIESPY